MAEFTNNMTLYDADGHRNILLRSFDVGPDVPCNQHLIVKGREAMLLDPGGHKLYSKVFATTKKALRKAELKHLFLSHQDPDIVAATNGWLMALPELQAWCSELWRRFVPHIGPNHLMFTRMKGIPDGGCRIPLGDSEVWVLPAHFLHSSGNFHVYDPVSKVLYTGDLGASLGEDYREVIDFDAHIRFMKGFHERYMGSTRAVKLWLEMVRTLDIQTIAPQHGAMFIGPEMVERFLDWLDSLEVGADRLEPYTIPE